MFITIDGNEYELATTLRVAYKLQNYNNHKSYTDIFAEMGNMGIEDQILILYCAFSVANPTNTEITKQKFIDWFLDNSNVTDIMELIQQVVSGILGKDITEGSEDKEISTAKAVAKPRR